MITECPLCTKTQKWLLQPCNLNGSFLFPYAKSLIAFPVPEQESVGSFIPPPPIPPKKQLNSPEIIQQTRIKDSESWKEEVDYLETSGLQDWWCGEFFYLLYASYGCQRGLKPGITNVHRQANKQTNRQERHWPKNPERRNPTEPKWWGVGWNANSHFTRGHIRGLHLPSKSHWADPTPSPPLLLGTGG